MSRRQIALLFDEYPFARSDDAFLDEIVTDRPGDGPIFACGSGPAAPVCRCAHLADILCDWPMGRGKTCDLPLCPDCAHHVGEDQDFCGTHFAIFTKESGTTRIFPRKPTLVR